MKLKPSIAAASVAVFVAVLSLAGCGGGGGGSSSSTVVANPAQFSATDVVLGTGTEAATGKTATVTYTGWLYSDTAADHKGTQFDTGTFSFTLGQNQAIAGFEQGVLGMKVGGKRTVLIPASMAYGAAGSAPKIPPNAGLVFDLALTTVQ
jgi:FKBP-type peptidyl-prolyl cis-trans isomerase FkpA